MGTVLSLLLGLCSPMTWLIAAMIFILWSRARERFESKRGRPSKGRLKIAGSAAAVGLAFQFLSIAYRPNHAFITQAQIQQVEDADEDDNGDPESPLKHFHRQLRGIRRGEPVERLIWRLE